MGPSEAPRGPVVYMVINVVRFVKMKRMSVRASGHDDHLDVLAQPRSRNCRPFPRILDTTASCVIMLAPLPLDRRAQAPGPTRIHRRICRVFPSNPDPACAIQPLGDFPTEAGSIQLRIQSLEGRVVAGNSRCIARKKKKALFRDRRTHIPGRHDPLFAPRHTAWPVGDDLTGSVVSSLGDLPDAGGSYYGSLCRSR